MYQLDVMRPVFSDHGVHVAPDGRAYDLQETATGSWSLSSLASVLTMMPIAIGRAHRLGGGSSHTTATEIAEARDAMTEAGGEYALANGCVVRVEAR